MSSPLDAIKAVVKILQYRWFCDKCNETTVRRDIREGTDLCAENTWPTTTPSSQLCPQCGDRASFISAHLRTKEN